MTEREAGNILQDYLNRMPTVLEDDDGNEIPGWHRHVGERYKGEIENPRNGSQTPQGKGSLFFVAYTLPPDVDMGALTEEQREEYGSLHGVDDNGQVFMPEL